MWLFTVLAYLCRSLLCVSTSKRCPHCKKCGHTEDAFLAQLKYRTLTCDTCKATFDRDDVGATNIAAVVFQWMHDRTRPAYLDADWAWKFTTASDAARWTASAPPPLEEVPHLVATRAERLGLAATSQSGIAKARKAAANRRVADTPISLVAHVAERRQVVASSRRAVHLAGPADAAMLGGGASASASASAASAASGGGGAGARARRQGAAAAPVAAHAPGEMAGAGGPGRHMPSSGAASAAGTTALVPVAVVLRRQGRGSTPQPESASRGVPQCVNGPATQPVTQPTSSRRRSPSAALPGRCPLGN